MSIIARRSFLTGIGALIAAPAIVRADSLMRVRGIVLPQTADFSEMSVSNGYAVGGIVDGELIRVIFGSVVKKVHNLNHDMIAICLTREHP